MRRTHTQRDIVTDERQATQYLRINLDGESNALYPVLSVDIHDGVDSLQFSDGSTLSSHDLNDIELHLATDRSDLS